MTVLRTDGSRTTANITIADTAPGFGTGQSCRGPAIGVGIQTFSNGRQNAFPLSACKGIDCWANPVAMTSGAVTRVRVDASGFRNARSARDIQVTIAGVRVPVVSYAKANDRGTDYLTIEIPAALAGLGEADLLMPPGRASVECSSHPHWR